MLSLGLSYYACLLIELIYPTFASLKAIQSSDRLDDTQWLTYWVVYAVLSTAQSLASVFLAWVPLYWEMKCCLILWMIAPQTQVCGRGPRGAPPAMHTPRVVRQQATRLP
ncbi:Receptor expression-enhancing protein 5 [Tetrabaena socialis]|uniref:HVA22-like protein n=1 Tax=Tetrabaena socialis TaxID=47790 RepID=A0A2J7ZMF4_9CHLO|nr:Receptor expression-enhancing protein 5 [Tetrabaena socialis]|eukprot:PNH01448.1 Receptor expression-enhancing protein 5 [Tetrabaena socialis]